MITGTMIDPAASKDDIELGISIALARAEAAMNIIFDNQYMNPEESEKAIADQVFHIAWDNIDIANGLWKKYLGSEEGDEPT